MPRKKPNMIFYGERAYKVIDNNDSTLTLIPWSTGIKLEAELKDTISGVNPDPFMPEILAITGADPEILIQSPRLRRREYVLSRQLHMMVRHQAYKESLRVSAGWWSQDHATALNGIKVITGLREVDLVFRRKTDRLMEMINNYIS
jgi:hypothetical protein